MCLWIRTQLEHIITIHIVTSFYWLGLNMNWCQPVLWVMENSKNHSIFNNIVPAKSPLWKLLARSSPGSSDGADLHNLVWQTLNILYDLISVSFNLLSLMISEQVANESCQHAVLFPQRTHTSTRMSELAETAEVRRTRGSDKHRMSGLIK